MYRIVCISVWDMKRYRVLNDAFSITDSTISWSNNESVCKIYCMCRSWCQTILGFLNLWCTEKKRSVFGICCRPFGVENYCLFFFENWHIHQHSSAYLIYSARCDSYASFCMIGKNVSFCIRSDTYHDRTMMMEFAHLPVWCMESDPGEDMVFKTWNYTLL